MRFKKKLFALFNLESFSVRTLLILSFALPLTINLVFINIFFFANNAIKSSHEDALRYKELSADSKFLAEHVHELFMALHAYYEEPEAENKTFPRLLNFFDIKINSLKTKITDSKSSQKLLESISADSLKLSNLPRQADSIPEAIKLLRTINENTMDYLKKENNLREKRALSAKHSIDFEFNLLVYAMIIILVYFLIIVFILKKSFFKTLNRIIVSLKQARNGVKLTRPPILMTELSHIENEIFELYTKLEERSLENEGFVYCVSHDLRSPLINIEEFSKDLNDDISSINRIITDADINNSELRNRTDEALESLRYIQSSVGKIKQIVGSVLELSRAGRIPIHDEIIDLNVKLKTIVTSISSSIRDTGAIVEFSNLPVIMGDRTAVSQIFLNLITNSLKYRDNDRALIIKIQENFERSNDHYVAIDVVDNGVGIPPQYLERVFLPFEQIKKRKIPGEGLGLSIVKRLILRIGGEVSVESKEGDGTTFTLIFRRPLKVPEAVNVT